MAAVASVAVAIVVAVAGFRRLDPSREKTATSLGAGPGRVLRRINLPLLRPAIVAGASLAVVAAPR